MRNTLFIDGRDAFLEYGVFVEKNGYKQVIQLPALKKVDVTDWPEEDGVEVDLIAPVLDTRSLQVQFCITNIRYAEDLFDELSNGAYHTFDFREIGKTYRLRMTSNGAFSSLIKLGKLTLTFSDDFPQVPIGEHYALDQSDIRHIGFELDGVDFSQFGAYVLKGSTDSIRKAANTKDNLKITAKDFAGVKYDSSAVRFKSKDVTLKLLIDAPDITEFWKRYNSLFSVLLQPETRVFYFAEADNEYDCYYKSMSVSKFDILRSGKVWCEFNLIITTIGCRHNISQILVTEDFDNLITQHGAMLLTKPKFGISILTTENGAYLVTESREKILINIHI